MSKGKELIKAAIYARYSTEKQDVSSITDQYADCRDYAKRHGYAVVAEYRDEEKTSQTLFDRDGLHALLAAAKQGMFQAVIAEHPDRFARDQSDLPWLFKQFEFLGVELVTICDGPLDYTKIGIHGLQGEMFLKNLSSKVRRHHKGRAREGLIAGVVHYGYSKVDGKPGAREINPTEASIVKRMFQERAEQRKSIRQIAAGLQRDGVPTRKGAVWSHQNVLRALTNQLYIGQLEWGVDRRVKNPNTGKFVKQRGQAEDLIVKEVPHLRIISDELWAEVQELGSDRRADKASGRRPFVTRSEHLLSGLLCCAECGGSMRTRSKSRGIVRVSCANAERFGNCSHRRSYNLPQLQRGVADGMRKHLTNPRAIAEMARAHESEFKGREKQNRVDHDSASKQRSRVQFKITRIQTLVTESDVPLADLGTQLKALYAERDGLDARLKQIEAERSRPTLHPSLVATYCANVEQLAAAISSTEVTPEYRAAFLNLIQSIKVHPTPAGADYEISPYGRLGALLGADSLFPTVGKVTGSARDTRTSLVATKAVTGPRQSRYSNDAVVLLGRWAVAA